MYFANPWGLAALAAVPVIVAIHLFRRRFPPLYVAGAHLWGAETRVSDAGRTRDRLPITASLLLELLAAILLAIALSEPRLSETEAAEHLIAVLDDSASMQAGPPEGPTFREKAVGELRRRMQGFDRNARITLIRTGVHPTLLGQRAMPWTEAEKELQTWKPSAAKHEFHAAWDEAVQMVGQDGKFLFLTDHSPDASETLPKGMEVTALGEPLGNVAFSAARWGLDTPSGDGQVFLRIANFGAAPANVTVTAKGAAGGLFSRELTIPAKSEVPLTQTLRPGLEHITIDLTSPQDSLAVDNHVTLVEPKRRVVNVAMDLPADSVELKLADRALATVPDIDAASTDSADLVIASATEQPPARSSLWWLGIGPLNRSEAFRKQAVDFVGPWLIERQHPLMDGITLGGVVWGGVQPTDLRLSPVISVDRTTVFGRIEGSAATAWLMNIDLARSNLGDSPDWPILISNLVELRREALPGLRNWNYRLEEPVQLRLPVANAEKPGELVLLTPDGRRRPLVRDRGDLIDVPPLRDAGLYRIVEGTTPQGEFAVNFFDPEESSLLALSSGEIKAPKTYEAAKINLDNPFSWLIVVAILLILAAIVLDWQVLGRGRARRAAQLGDVG